MNLGRYRLGAAVIVVAMVACVCRADVRVGPLFADHMVLQRDAILPVWGTAGAGEAVVVRVDGQSAATVADSQGRWMVYLRPMRAGGPHTLTIAGPRNTLHMDDVLVGDVWLCSGQSNMAMTLGESAAGKAAAASADYPSIRYMGSLAANPAAVPSRDLAVEVPWTVCRPRDALRFSGVAYHFGRRLHQELGVPVGLVCNAVSGTYIESWISMRNCDPLAALRRIKSDLTAFAYNSAYYDWSQRWLAAVRAAAPPPACPQALWEKERNRPSTLFNGNVAPLAPFAIRGVAWYQGENNTLNMAADYDKLMATLVRDWRRAWLNDDLPFVYVQLPRRPDKNYGWVEVREKQLAALSIPRTAMAVTVDLGDGELHPADKRPFGERLAIAALGAAYGKRIEFSGPLYRAAKVEGGSIRVSFDHVGGGLVSAQGSPAGAASPTGKASLAGFQVAGADRRFVPAEARIDGGTVVVSSPRVPQPVAVRYAWQGTPQVSLYNREGLPASPFRTDKW